MTIFSIKIVIHLKFSLMFPSYMESSKGNETQSIIIATVIFIITSTISWLLQAKFTDNCATTSTSISSHNAAPMFAVSHINDGETRYKNKMIRRLPNSCLLNHFVMFAPFRRHIISDQIYTFYLCIYNRINIKTYKLHRKYRT
jgi:hypothetical protein